MTTIVCGVDVSSAQLDARVGGGGPWQRFARTAEGVAALAAFCREHGVGLVAMEATGGEACPPAGRRPDRGERPPFALLWAAGLPAAVLNPRQSLPRTRSGVRRLAEAMGILERTDRIDAGIIARFAEVGAVAPAEPPGAAQRRLAALTTRLRQLTGLRVALAHQRRLADEPDACWPRSTRSWSWSGAKSASSRARSRP